MGGKDGKSGADSGEKARRLAEALRENLRRRKAQARERARTPDPVDPAKGGEPGKNKD